MNFEIKSRFTGKAKFTAAIECEEDELLSVKIGLAVKLAINNDADLCGADLRSAELCGADWMPKIQNIHQQVYKHASVDGALKMDSWHCGTAHCRAGWVVNLSGEGGKVLEGCYGTSSAAAMIYMASDPELEKIPDFYCDNEEALVDMERMSLLEASK